MNENPQRLVIVSHVVHYSSGNQLFAYGPYAREIDIWADLFPEVVIAAPCRAEAPAGDCLPFTRSNIWLFPQWETGGDTLAANVTQLLALPVHIWNLSRAMLRADAIHVRCPGNLGLLGLILAPLFSRRLIAKYAGQWNAYQGEPWTWRLQKRILRSWWWRGPVTVYGRWPHQPANIVPFFTSILTAEQVERARAAAARKSCCQPLRLLYVGRLSPDKNVRVLLAAVAQLKNHGIQTECKIVGEGPERQSLEAMVADSGLHDCVMFAGGIKFEDVLDYYEQADVLVLVSRTEGWPKAIVEAMAFGLICIGLDGGLVPHMLAGGRGIVVPPGDVEALTAALERISEAPEDHETMKSRAAAWAQEYSLEGLREALRQLLAARWQVPVNPIPGLTDVQRGALNS
jgi:glycosyltransferase involved in cell wall biosynthesis